jgi:hypothetical protein
MIPVNNQTVGVLDNCPTELAAKTCANPLATNPCQADLRITCKLHSEPEATTLKRHPNSSTAAGYKIVVAPEIRILSRSEVAGDLSVLAL